MSMVSHYPDKPDIVKAMVDLVEKAFQTSHDFLANKQLTLIPDEKDIYVNNLRSYLEKELSFI